MVKVRIKATQLIEIPDEAEIVSGPGYKLIKIGGAYYRPDIEFMVSNEYNESDMSFHELDEDTCDLLLGLKEEIVDIEEEL